MGWNAGGFGAMTFPSAAALEAWRRAIVSHEAHDDWIHELMTGSLPDETVDARLRRVAETHDPKSFVIQRVSIDGLLVELTYDSGEDDFRETAGDMAALVRSASEHGARGKFFFLGTAGAEGDFVYELTLDGVTSSVSSLGRGAIEDVYGGEGYRRFLANVAESMSGGGLPGVSPALPPLSTAKPPKARKARSRELPTDPVGAIDAMLGTTWKRTAGKAWRSIEERFGELSRTRPTEAIPSLVRWLEHPNLDVRGTALEVLLAYDDRAALETAAERFGCLGDPHAIKTAIWASFKLDPARSFDRLGFVFDSLRADPKRADPRAARVLAALRQSQMKFERPTFAERVGVPRDLPSLDPRWLDLCSELVEICGEGLSIEPATVLHFARDPRAPEARVEHHLRALGIDALEALERAIANPIYAGDVTLFEGLARRLRAMPVQSR